MSAATAKAQAGSQGTTAGGAPPLFLGLFGGFFYFKCVGQEGQTWNLLQEVAPNPWEER